MFQQLKFHLGKKKKPIPPDPNCLFMSASRLFPSPLMRAGWDKEVGNVQLLADSPRQCVLVEWGGGGALSLPLIPLPRPSSYTHGHKKKKRKVASVHLAEPWVLNYLGPVPPSEFHSN